MMSKMKVSSKPMSSPARTNKFPTPLMMRFLRSNVGSRSRGRSRSSPSMFIMRTKKNAAVISDANQPEPSSPKVTCIGQVRARRSAKKAQSKRRSTKNKPVPCCSSCSSCVWCSCSRSCPSCSRSCPSCSCSCSCCCVFRVPKLGRPRLCFAGFFRKWALFCRFGYCKKIDARDDSIVSITRQPSSAIVSSGGGGDGAAQERIKEELLESSGPPKNALLLTRCRSAPYRSSSLAGRFWGSDEAETEPETNPKTLKEMEDDYREAMDGGESGKPNSPCSVNGEVEEEEEEESRKCCSTSEELEMESCKNDNVGASKAAAAAGVSLVHPLILTRCKSEPARTGERLVPPEVSFCKQRRSDTSQACLQKGSANAVAAATTNCD